MKTEELECLLRNPPKVKVPAELLTQIRREISLPRPTFERPTVSPSFMRRWLPAMAAAIWLFACLVILAVQANTIRTLRHERARLAEAENTNPATTTTPSTLPPASSDDPAEREKLRALEQQLQAELSQLESLQAGNRELAAELHARAGVGGDTDFFEKAAAKAGLMKCVSHLKQFALAARIWSNEHGDLLPSDTSEFRDLLKGPELLCPETNLPYEIVSPGAPETDPSVPYAHCSKHNVVALCDGSVQQLGKRKLIRGQDGKLTIER